MSEMNKAVFLSYASQDTEAARRICEALRAVGVEVWFDQSELIGGDAWDSKIRGQIARCALFVPLISANTQARLEGYFRREWKQAALRTQDMAEERVFLLPVVIDDTRDGDARVPAEFKGVQWTRLPQGEPSSGFVSRVQRLLHATATEAASAPPPASPPVAAAAPAAPSAPLPTPAATVTGSPSRRPLWPIVTVAALAISGIAAYWFLRPAPATEPIVSMVAPPAAAPAEAMAKSLAVLPFANLSADKDAEFFADGVHEDLLTTLAKVRDLKVISRTSVLVYRDVAQRNLRQIARDLGVAHVLEGSVRRAGTKARITVQLIDARNDQHLWAESYDRDVTDLFAVQAEVAREITTALKATLTPGEESLIGRRPTRDAEAYDLYLRARVFDQNLQVSSSKEDYDRVVELYEAAAQRDPSFMLAWVEASIAHGTQFWFAALDSSPERRAKAAHALEKARALAPNSPEVSLAQGAYAYLCENDWRGALTQFRAAEARLPNDARLLYRMALAHRRLGESEEAEKLLLRVAALNPNDVRGLATLVETQVSLRRYREALATFERYRPLLATDAHAVGFVLTARLELTGDYAAYLRDAVSTPLLPNDRHGLEAAYIHAVEQGDLARADALLTDPRWNVVRGSGGVMSEPIALHRAQIAWLQGRTADAQRWAAEAIKLLERGIWTERQEPFVNMAVARAKSCAGLHEEAVREARAVFAQQERTDKFVVGFMRVWLGRILIAAGRNEEALEELRLHASGSAVLPAPSSLALDPFWAPLKTDPRFQATIRQQAILASPKS
jgi:TolB-like protein/Tfp pilus assembly protein PilF